MALPENARKSLLPSFLSSSPGLSSLKTLESRILASSPSSQMPFSASSPSRNPFFVDRLVVVPAPSEPGKIVMYLPAYSGGFLSCGLTHWRRTSSVGSWRWTAYFIIGTLTGDQWGIYDSFKVFVGLPTTGGPSPPTPAK